MEQNELVEQITKAVIRKLQEAEGGSGSPSASTAQQSQTRPAQPGEKPVAVPPTAQSLILPGELAPYIDHTILKPEATAEQVAQVCDEAIEHGFYSVCINTTWTEFCARRLRGSAVKLAVVVGFPLGAMDGRAKGFEARHAVELGADEIDMVMNIGALKSGRLTEVEQDIRWVRRSIRQRTVLKVILETTLLTDEEKVIACQIAKKAGADFVKTSTGFSKGGATTHDIALMRRTVGPKLGVKASGGVRTYDDALAMIQAGATRIGASSSVAIVSGGQGSDSY
ncbi:MAG: deoxyribose-phosphate aldolase [Spirochaetaceae bacterium]|nr:MAG: deoxyribose-phosphate aldolase [Spirochaetaceae bacterium]